MDFKFFIGKDITKIFAIIFHTLNMVSYLGYIIESNYTVTVLTEKKTMSRESEYRFE